MKCIILLVFFAGVLAINAVPIDDDDGDLVLYRRRRDIKYPSDCASSTLRSFATSCGLTVIAGAKHYIVKHGTLSVTTIPHTVKSNNTCRSIINELNRMCPNGVTAEPPPTTTTTKKPKAPPKKPRKG